MNEDQVRALIEAWVDKIGPSCNDVFIAHNDGVLRGLLWVLTGNDPGAYITTDMAKLFEMAGIPFKAEADGSLTYGKPDGK